MNVNYVDFPKQYADQREEILQALDRVMASGQYILGESVAQFEANFAALCQSKYAISVANGTDALVLSLKALGIGAGDEVITVPNSWVSSASCIVLVGAKPVFVDVLPDQNMDPECLEAAITPRTKAIIPVHLTGKCAEMDAILKIARQYGLFVIEDAAQAVGAQYHGTMAGSLGICGCFSLHPLKNLNGAGDGGVIVTNDQSLAEKLDLFRNHGLKSRNEIACWGYNSRLDSLQAAILNCRLPKLSQTIVQRRNFAKTYSRLLNNVVNCPEETPGCYDTYHLFVIQTQHRDALQNYLAEHQIQTAVHYPVPIHLQPAARSLNYKEGDFPNVEKQSHQILSLPIHNSLSQKQIEFVSQAIIDFFQTHLDSQESFQ